MSHQGPQVHWVAGSPASKSTLETFVANTAHAREACDLDKRERAQLAQVIESRISAFRPPIAALEAVRSLANPQTHIVLSIARPGFLGGTLNNVFAALHTIRLARSLTSATEQPHIPVLWNAADTQRVHDLHPSLFPNEHLHLRKVSLSSLRLREHRLEQLQFDERVHRIAACRELLEQLLATEPHRDAALQLCMPRDRDFWPNSFTRLFIDWLGPQGLVVLEPNWLQPQLSGCLADLFSPPNNRTRIQLGNLLAPGTKIATHWPTDKQPQRSVPVTCQTNGQVKCGDEPGSRTERELAAAIVSSPEQWSPSELSLPLALQRCLPIVALLDTNPDSAASQTAWSEQLQQPAPPHARTFSASLIDDALAHALERSQLSAPEALQLGDKLIEKHSQDSELVRSLQLVASDLRKRLKELEHNLSEESKALGYSLRRTAKRLDNELGKLRERARRRHSNQTGNQQRHRRLIHSMLCPGGRAQSEALGPLWLIARHGLGVGQELLDLIPALISPGSSVPEVPGATARSNAAKVGAQPMAWIQMTTLPSDPSQS